MLRPEDMVVRSLGTPSFPTPLQIPRFIDDGARVVIDVEYDSLAAKFAGNEPVLTLENAGPRRQLFFNPADTTAAIVTCGGLCPGLNNVIQAIVKQLHFQYGIKRILGIPYGYEGLNPAKGHVIAPLTLERVRGIDRVGGTILGSSRGNQDPVIMVDTLISHGVNILFAVGGDGTLRGAKAIADEIEKRRLNIAVVGVPKTIDNDIQYIDRTFGFETAVAIATEALHGAHAEATSAANGIGLVKLMGRDSGYIATFAGLASNEANYVLVPEVKFTLRGERGLLPHLKERLHRKKHALIVVAEGAGQELMPDTGERDASGNRKYGDVGLFLKKEIETYLKEEKVPFTLKYIDPSYIIRSVPASADDAVSCMMLAQNAVHGAMSGKTNFMIGKVNSYYVYVPIELATASRKKIDPTGYLWSIVKEATGQPDFV